MSQELSVIASPEEMLAIEKVVCTGDLKSLNAEQRVVWYKNRCDAAGLDYRTEPFIYVELNGKLKLYPTKTATEQVSLMRGISTEIVDERMVGDSVWKVRVRASYPDGRHTDSIGAVSIKGLQGDGYCNALMKAETKAKRRAVLSLTGLAAYDEAEVEDIPGAVVTSVETAHGPALPAPQVTQEAPNDQGEAELEAWQDKVKAVWTEQKIAPTAELFARILHVGGEEDIVLVKGKVSIKANVESVADAIRLIHYAEHQGAVIPPGPLSAAVLEQYGLIEE